MKDEAEYPVTVFTTFKSQSGFVVNATQRGNDLKEAFKKLGEFIKSEKGVPYERQSYSQKKPIEYVPDRLCPKCNEKLVYAATKIGKIIKCSTNKYDFATKTSSGCSFVEYPKPATAQAV